MARAIKLRALGHLPRAKATWGSGCDCLEPSLELFPFMGCISGRNQLADKEDATEPGEWPGDHQCILRLPADLAKRVVACLAKPDDPEDLDAPEPEPLDLHMEPVLGLEGVPTGRRWRVKVFGEMLTGTLVDLPSRVESHVLLKGPQSEAVGGTGTAAYKSADVYQMLIVHRGARPPGASRELDERTFQWNTGLSPPAQKMRSQRFRGLVHPESEFSFSQIGEVEAAIRARMNNEEYSYEELWEVDEAEAQEIKEKYPDSIWRPPRDDPREFGGGAASTAAFARRVPSAASVSAASGSTATGVAASERPRGPDPPIKRGMASGGRGAAAAAAGGQKRGRGKGGGRSKAAAGSGHVGTRSGGAPHPALSSSGALHGHGRGAGFGQHRAAAAELPGRYTGLRLMSGGNTVTRSVSASAAAARMVRAPTSRAPQQEALEPQSKVRRLRLS